MKRKGILLVGFLLIAVGLIFAGAQGESSLASTAGKPVTLRFADFHATGTVHAVGIEKFKKLVEEVSEGNINVEVFLNGTLGAQAELIESVKNGTIQMTYANSPTLSNYVKEFSVFDLPFTFTDWDHIKAVLYGDVGKELGEILVDKTGMRILTWVHSGFRDMLTANTYIDSIDDFSGVIFRSPEAFAFVSMFEALGASPAPMPWTEVYEAVRTGVIDGLETTVEAIVSNQLWEVCKYVIVTHHIYTGECPIINETFWKGLTEQQQSWILDSLLEVAAWQNSEIEAKEDEYYETMKENGMELIYIDREQLIEACNAAWDKYIKMYPSAQKYITAINELR